MRKVHERDRGIPKETVLEIKNTYDSFPAGYAAKALLGFFQLLYFRRYHE